jgi:hypothetical protein
MRILKIVTGLSGMVLGALAICLAIFMDRVFSSSGIFNWGTQHDRTFMGILIVLGIGLLIAGYDFAFR